MQPINITRYLFSIIMLVGLYACAGSDALLNSERIEQTYGSYGVEVLRNETLRRESSLYSGAGDTKTTRTYAVVGFQVEPRSAYAQEHTLIEAGGSIGATFRRAGWAIDKRHLFIGELEMPDTYATIGELMRIDLPKSLATHVYLLIVTKDKRSFTYATISEIHHPDYLSAADLNAIYGEIIFDDSNRDSIHDFIGPPNPPK
jgi:hypothetical protein